MKKEGPFAFLYSIPYFYSLHLITFIYIFTILADVVLKTIIDPAEACVVHRQSNTDMYFLSDPYPEDPPISDRKLADVLKIVDHGLNFQKHF